MFEDNHCLCKENAPECADDKVKELKPAEKQTRDQVLKDGKVKFMCAEAAHLFDEVLPTDPNLLAEFLSLVLPV